MKVILLKDIPKIGKKDQIKDVSDGFAQNALLPKGLAKIATAKEIDLLNARIESSKNKLHQEIEETKTAINALKTSKLVVELAANQQGHLFSKFKIEQLKKILKERDIQFDSKYITPFEIKEIGIHVIKIKTPQMQDSFEIEIRSL